eukprot:scaffold521_cov167-Amphora_coffeaeformis.AAC.17
MDAGARAILSDDQNNLPFFAATATLSVNEVFLMLRVAASEGLFEHVKSPVKTLKRKRENSVDSLVAPNTKKLNDTMIH